MLRNLHLLDVGPTRELSFDFAPRLNVLTGDNGLGKTFVLDVVWWVLTGTWAGEQAFPWCPPAGLDSGDGGLSDGAEDADSPGISATVAYRDAEEGAVTGGVYQRESQEWRRKPWQPERRPPTGTTYGPSYGARISGNRPFVPPSLVVYARIDGTFAVWDAYQVKGDSAAVADAAVMLDAVELWQGKEEVGAGTSRRRTVCRGLLEDWVTWQNARTAEFAALERALGVLSAPSEPLVAGPPTRVRLDDRKDIPTLTTPHGQVPVIHASAGVRRVLGIAYVLVWAWSEHVKAADLTGRRPTRDLVVLIDEVELHLHPSWQRVLLPAVLNTIAGLAPEAAVQVLATSHAPLVLASLEPLFREEIDELFHFRRDGAVVAASGLPFARQGDASNWLVSEVFGLERARSKEAEMAIEAALAFMRQDLDEAERHLGEFVERVAPTSVPAGDPRNVPQPPDESLEERIHDALRAVLPDHDDFWPQWVLSYQRLERGAPGGS